MKATVSLLVTDLDNTLYDWVAMWHKSFSAMLDILIAKSGVPRHDLESEIKTIFQRYGTSEYAFVIEEIPSLKIKHKNEDLTIVYQDAIAAYRTARESSLRLYPGVIETLKAVKKNGCIIVAYTESMEFYTRTRIKSLGLDGLIDYVYSPPDHDKPESIASRHKNGLYKLQHTIQRFTPFGEYKPNPEILLKIISDDGIHASRENTIYVGDNIMKDVKMAQDAKVIDVHAKYGVAAHTEEYNVLRRVTHWTQEDVDREKTYLAGDIIVPTYVIESSLSQLLNYFDFIQHKRF
ncbi:MAG: HAD family hydrolase [Blastocatellales bacterium]